MARYLTALAGPAFTLLFLCTPPVAHADSPEDYHCQIPSRLRSHVDSAIVDPLDNNAWGELDKAARIEARQVQFARLPPPIYPGPDQINVLYSDGITNIPPEAIAAWLVYTATGNAMQSLKKFANLRPCTISVEEEQAALHGAILARKEAKEKNPSLDEPGLDYLQDIDSHGLLGAYVYLAAFSTVSARRFYAWAGALEHASELCRYFQEFVIVPVSYDL